MFDYRLEDTGISNINDDDEEEEEGKQVATGLPRVQGGEGPARKWLFFVRNKDHKKPHQQPRS